MQPKDLLVHLEKGDRRLEMLRDFSDASLGITNLGTLNRLMLNSQIQQMSNMTNQAFNIGGLGSWFNT